MFADSYFDIADIMRGSLQVRLTLATSDDTALLHFNTVDKEMDPDAPPLMLKHYDAYEEVQHRPG